MNVPVHTADKPDSVLASQLADSGVKGQANLAQVKHVQVNNAVQHSYH